MKLTFEGKTFFDILNQMESVLAGENISKAMSEKPGKNALPLDELVGPGGPGPDAPKPVDKPVEKPVDIPGITAGKPKRARTPKQLENDEKLRAAALEKIAAKKAAKAGASAPEPEPEIEDPTKMDAPMDPAEMVRIRQKTIEDLQSAYANGYQKEVFELLARFGNGAKSFRELPPESFVPIRHAIDHGALT